MIEIAGRTIGAVFAEAVTRHGEADFLMAPPRVGGARLSYDDTAAIVSRWAALLRAAGYGTGHRIAVQIGNRPEHLALKLALNTAGISIVPINPDYRPGEVAYLLEDSDAVLIVTEPAHVPAIRAGMFEAGRDLPLVMFDEPGSALPPAPAAAHPPLSPQSEASLLYTSGTTGRPKGCILSHEYELMIGERYLSAGPLMAMGEGERVLNPLPLYHLNAAAVSFMGMLLAGGCQIQQPRFSARNWWQDVRESGATIVHCLGIVVPALMALPPGPEDRDHRVRLAISAGADPSQHRAFERRFGLELVEIWGMTEMCRILASAEEPSLPETRAIGRPFPGLEVRVVDAADRDLPPGTPGEMILRHSAETPRHGFFSGYLNKPEATEAAWRGGWFHTGDTVTQDETGMIFFVDRAKNIIRRAGENIAAAEIEACLHERGEVAQVAVIAVPDPMREEEVMACIVPAAGAQPGPELARALFDHVFTRLAYYKAPGWVLFLDELPVTGTQKVLKHRIFGPDEDPLARPGIHDLRELKRREAGL
ncbi:MAG: long-chain fatty acid--CoA ligase [Alphaproteobacteria bacterium]|nr:MAG: long-chain fatty acid--CoA ligase [Alphaproteobacteria bacterium]